MSPTSVQATSQDPAANRTVAVAAAGTLLVLAAFSAALTSVGDSTRAVHGGISGATWTLSGMSLGLATALLTVGAMADDFGRRRVLLYGTALLAATSALAALASSIELLVAARVLQGVGGAGVLTASLALIGHAFPAGVQRARAAAVWGAAVGGGIALGPLAGAAVSAPFGWRASYWLVAAGAAALLPAALRIGESRADVPRGLDLPGAATLAASMAALTAGLIEGRSDWGSATTIALLAGGALLLVAFAAVELMSRRPMVELHRFRHPPFLASVTGALFTGVAVIGLMSYSTTVLARGLHVGIIASAAVLAAWSGTSMVVALAARRFGSGRRAEMRLAVGLGLAAAGELALSGLSGGGSWRQLLPGLLVAGVGSGVANAALGGLAVESVPAERAGMGSGANNTARYLGGAAGVALVVAIAAGRGSGAASGSALVSGWNTAALVSAGLCALGALIAAWCGTRQPSPVARRADALANRSGKQFRAQLVGGGEQRRG